MGVIIILSKLGLASGDAFMVTAMKPIDDSDNPLWVST